MWCGQIRLTIANRGTGEKTIEYFNMCEEAETRAQQIRAEALTAFRLGLTFHLDVVAPPTSR